jgi:hypothetical protein
MKRFISFVILIFSTLSTISALAEYRAFLLRITTPDGEIKQFKSTLDPLQYPAYHHLKPGEILTYDTSWMCPGRTSHQPICDNPQDLIAEEADPTKADRNPAAENAPAAKK